MLAEIFLLQLETMVRAAAANGSNRPASDQRFVPITPPRK